MPPAKTASPIAMMGVMIPPRDLKPIAYAAESSAIPCGIVIPDRASLPRIDEDRTYPMMDGRDAEAPAVGAGARRGLLLGA